MALGPLPMHQHLEQGRNLPHLRLNKPSAASAGISANPHQIHSQISKDFSLRTPSFWIMASCCTGVDGFLKETQLDPYGFYHVRSKADLHDLRWAKISRKNRGSASSNFQRLSSISLWKPQRSDQIDPEDTSQQSLEPEVCQGMHWTIAVAPEQNTDCDKHKTNVYSL